MIITTSVDELFPAQALALLPDMLRSELVAAIATAARDKWITLAQARLSGTRRDYMMGIQEVDFAPGHASVSLVGVLPNIIENGMKATDLHDTLLGPNVPVVPRGGRGKHQKKGGGYYRSIPFRHATPGTSGAAGPAMGSAYAGHSGLAAGFTDLLGRPVSSAAALGRNIHRAAKALAPTTGMPGGRVSYGGRLPAGMAPKLRPHHATDIYAGMIRSQKTYRSATQNQYTTFRTISTGSPGWMRRATDGIHLASEVHQQVLKIAPMALKQFLAAKGLGA